MIDDYMDGKMWVKEEGLYAWAAQGSGSGNTKDKTFMGTWSHSTGGDGMRQT